MYSIMRTKNLSKFCNEKTCSRSERYVDVLCHFNQWCVTLANLYILAGSFVHLLTDCRRRFQCCSVCCVSVLLSIVNARSF